VKHAPLFQKINSLVSSFSKQNSLVIDGFHPDFLLPLLRVLNCPVIITTPNKYFGIIVKHLSSLWDDRSVVFVSDQNTVKRAPCGFLSQQKLFLRRAKEGFSAGVENIRTIVCSNDGLSVPVVGSGAGGGLVFNEGVVFDVCLEFLIAEGYGPVDFVGHPGEYSIRGGILDVYPFSSVCPYRLNFLDSVPTVFMFDVDTQLTAAKITNFKLSSASVGVLRSLNEVSLNQFLPIKFNGIDGVCLGFGGSMTYKISLDVLTHSQFLLQDSSLFNSITIIDDLSSVGVVDEKKNLFIPAWFTKKEGVSGQNNERGSVPLPRNTFFFCKPSRNKKIFFLINNTNRRQIINNSN
jgi:hypothetical protein